MAAVTRAQKNAETEILRERFSRAVSTVVLDPQGVSVEITTALRARFRQAGVDYRVVKNNLVRKAIAGTALEKSEAFDRLFVGMTGVAWSFEDPSAAAKVLKAFRKEHEDHEKVTVKGAVLDTQVFAAAQVESQLAALPGKNEIRAMLLAQLLAPAQSLVRQLQAAGQNLSYVLDARKRQLEQNP